MQLLELLLYLYFHVFVLYASNAVAVPLTYTVEAVGFAASVAAAVAANTPVMIASIIVITMIFFFNGCNSSPF